MSLKGGYPIIFAANVFHNSHLIQKCIRNQQQLLILYTFLETALLCQSFVFWVRYFKFWPLAYFLISFNCAKFQQSWTTLIFSTGTWKIWKIFFFNYSSIRRLTALFGHLVWCDITYFWPLHKQRQNWKQLLFLYRFPFIFKTVHCLIFHWQTFQYFSAVFQLQNDARFGTRGLEHMIKAVTCAQVLTWPEFNLRNPAQNELWHQWAPRL